MTHRGPFQPLLFCDSVLFNCSQLYIILDALSSKESTVIEFVFIFLSKKAIYLLRGSQQL